MAGFTKEKFFITNSPAFYKNNLFNKLYERIGIEVLFLSSEDVIREKDFFEGEKYYKHLFWNELKLNRKIILILDVVKASRKELILGGWDHGLYWILLLLRPRALNSMILESSVYESSITGYRKILKRLFLSRVGNVYASGRAQIELLLAINYQGKITKTGGVGLINTNRRIKKVGGANNFCFIGRLAKEKNLELLIDAFKARPNYNLHIVGSGPMASILKDSAPSNVNFRGHIANKDIQSFLANMKALILPSISEPWGLVVEEAIYGETPVIVSSRVGCKDDLVLSDLGMIFSFDSIVDLLFCLDEMMNNEKYGLFRQRLSEYDYTERQERYVTAFI